MQLHDTEKTPVLVISEIQQKKLMHFIEIHIKLH